MHGVQAPDFLFLLERSIFWSTMLPVDVLSRAVGGTEFQLAGSLTNRTGGTNQS